MATGKSKVTYVACFCFVGQLGSAVGTTVGGYG